MEPTPQTLTVLLIEDSPDYAKIVQHWLSQSGGEIKYVLNWTDSLAESRNRLGRGNVSVILLDLNLADSEGTSTFAAIHALVPEIPVIILSAGDDVATALHLIQEGAHNYLVKSTCSAEALTRAIRYAVVKRGSNSSRAAVEAPLQKSTIVAVTGGKGGVGVTTVACALAGELRRSGEAVLLADLDMHTGLVAFLMAVESQYSVMDAISNSAKLDRGLWQRLVVQSEEGIDVICSAAKAGSAAAPPDRLTEVLTAIKPFYRWIVLDLGRLHTCAPEVLEAADEQVVVTSTSIPALYETKRALETLRVSGMGDRIRLTVNQISPEECAAKDLHSIFGIEVSAVLPSSSRELYQSCVEGRTPGGSVAFGREIAKLAETIGGPRKVPAQSPAPGKWFRRSRKAPAQAAVK